MLQKKEPVNHGIGEKYKEIKMQGKDKLSQAHLDAIPTLLRPLIECKGRKTITSGDAHKILYEWDQARRVKNKLQNN